MRQKKHLTKNKRKIDGFLSGNSRTSTCKFEMHSCAKTAPPAAQSPVSRRGRAPRR